MGTTKKRRSKQNKILGTVESEGSNSKPSSPYSKEASYTGSICSSEDIDNATKADLSSVPMYFLDNVNHTDATVQEMKSFLNFIPDHLIPTSRAS